MVHHLVQPLVAFEKADFYPARAVCNKPSCIVFSPSLDKAASNDAHVPHVRYLLIRRDWNRIVSSRSVWTEDGMHAFLKMICKVINTKDGVFLSRLQFSDLSDVFGLSQIPLHALDKDAIGRVVLQDELVVLFADLDSSADVVQ